MSRPTFYRHCLLRRELGPGRTTETVSYIPEPFGRVGAVLKLRDGSGEWTDGWRVITASGLVRAEVAEAVWKAMRHFDKQLAAKNGE
jgi:hypothetical protein